MNITPIIDLTTLEQYLTLILIFSLGFFFSLQVFSMLSPPKPRYTYPLAGAGAVGVLVVVAVYQWLSIVPATMTASMVGVYGTHGYIYIIGVLGLVLVFLTNTVICWGQNKPLKLFQ
jgi:hypothetical protein